MNFWEFLEYFLCLIWTFPDLFSTENYFEKEKTYLSHLGQARRPDPVHAGQASARRLAHLGAAAKQQRCCYARRRRRPFLACAPGKLHAPCLFKARPSPRVP
jgi:hypothetical protein